MYLKYSLASLILISILTSASGQKNFQEIDFIENIIRRRQDTATIFYFDSVATSYRINDIKSNITKKRIKSHWINGSSSNNSIILSKQELKFIYSKLDSMAGIVWRSNLFDNSILITAGTNWEANIFKDFSESKWDIKSGRQIWEFTEPIFLRNNSICLLNLLYICGGTCGHTELCFYKHEGSNWERWIVVSSGDF